MFKIGIVGPGKVGTSMAVHMKVKGLSVSSVYARRYEKAVELADRLKAQAYKSLETFIPSCDLIFITTSDSAICKIGEKIALLNGDGLKGKTVIHCSGALSSNELASCQEKGAVVASIHPLMAFSGTESDSEKLATAVMTVESNSVQNNMIKELMKGMNNPYRLIKPWDKVLYHGGAVVVSNYMVTLVEEGLKYLEAVGIKEEALPMLIPLMEGTLQNIKEKGTVNGLTGPLVRCDTKVLQGHMQAISDQLEPSSAEFYRMMGRMTVDMIRGKRITDKEADRIDELFVKEVVLEEKNEKI